MYRVVTPQTAAEPGTYCKLRWKRLCKSFHLPVGANSRMKLCIG